MNISIKLTDNYLDILSSLSDEMKIRIINRLSESLMNKKKADSIEELFGVWKDDRSAEDVIADIREHRLTGTRTIESLSISISPPIQPRQARHNFYSLSTCILNNTLTSGYCAL